MFSYYRYRTTQIINYNYKMNVIINQLQSSTNNFTTHSHDYKFNLSRINKIDGIKVVAYIHIIFNRHRTQKDIKFYLRILHNSTNTILYTVRLNEIMNFTDREFYEPEFIDTFKSVLRQSYSIISNLKYVPWLPRCEIISGFCNGLYTQDVINDNSVFDDIFNEFKNSLIENNVTLYYIERVECCVCYNLTINKTKCNHYICLRCFDNINYISNDDNLVKPCPICRNNISIDDNDDNDDDDEDA